MTTQLHASPATMPRGLRETYFNEFRLAAYVLVLYTLGHTLGAVINTPQFGVGSDAVVTLMKSVRVVVQGAECTWYGFYRGFGAFVSIYFAFSVYVTWLLGGTSGEDRRCLLPIGWAMFASHACGAVVAVIYFFPVPIVLSILVTVLLGVGCFRSQRDLRAAT
jgi:hypothetical protein